jgi:hypothetical protein
MRTGAADVVRDDNYPVSVLTPDQKGAVAETAIARTKL